eukprot:gene19564-26246_t
MVDICFAAELLIEIDEQQVGGVRILLCKQPDHVVDPSNLNPRKAVVVGTSHTSKPYFVLPVIVTLV